MNEYDRLKQGKTYEGWAFTFCKAAFLVLIFRRYSLLALSGLAALFYVVAQLHGVREWRCWAKPPWVTLFWAAVFASQIWALTIGRPLPRSSVAHRPQQVGPPDSRIVRHLRYNSG